MLYPREQLESATDNTSISLSFFSCLTVCLVPCPAKWRAEAFLFFILCLQKGYLQQHCLSHFVTS